MPDVAPETGMQPEPQFVPPHVTAATGTVGTVALYLPCLQSRQLEATTSITYLPAAQTVQAASAVAAIVVEYLPAVQSVHELAPVTDLYFPATQSSHALPVYPALHWHEVRSAEEGISAGQSEQAVSAVAVIISECLPSSQLVHVASTVTDLYFPATQASHAIPV